MTDYREWLSTFTDDAGLAVASKLGVSPQNLNRQLAGTANMPPETIVKIARVYGVNPLPGLIVQGLILEDDVTDLADNLAITAALQKSTDDQLLREVKRRLDQYKNAREGNK